MNHHKNARTHYYSRVLIVERVMQHGQEAGRVAADLGISERCVYTWLKRYREEGWSGLHNRSSRPKRIPNKTDEQIAATICHLRRTYHMTAMAIARALQKAYSVVARILAKNGLGQGFACANADKPKRYERTQPGELIHMDIKILNRFWQPGHRVTGDRRSKCKGAGWEYVHVAIDDYSRMAYAETLSDSTATTCAAFMIRALRFFRQHGIYAQRVMTDNGTGYVSRYFAKIMRLLDLKHKRTQPYTPRTNGKAERFIRTLLNEWAYARAYPSSDERAKALPTFVDFYNHVRKHGGINYQTPITRCPIHEQPL
jgi:transposase InsO family protein